MFKWEKNQNRRTVDSLSIFPIVKWKGQHGSTIKSTTQVIAFELWWNSIDFKPCMSEHQMPQFKAYCYYLLDLCYNPAWSHFARCIEMLQSSHFPDCIICVLLQINNRGGNFANCTWPNGSCPQHLKMQTVKHFAAAAVKQEHNNVKVFFCPAAS